MAFRWVESEAELEAIENGIMPSLEAEIDGVSYQLRIVPSEEFVQIGTTEYSYKINSVQNNLKIAGRMVSLAIIELQRGDQTWERWVFDNPTMTRDVVEDTLHEETSAQLLDANISTAYYAGDVPITIVGGLDDGSYRMLTSIRGDEPHKRNPCSWCAHSLNGRHYANACSC